MKLEFTRGELDRAKVKAWWDGFMKGLLYCLVLQGLMLIAKTATAETPNWFLYDQRMGQKAQEYKNRWSTGNDGDKLAATYYDAALGFEYISRRLGDPSLTNTALAAAQYYSSNYVVPAGGVVPGNWIFTDGLRKFGFGSTVNLLAQNGSYCMSNVAHEPLYDTVRSREVAYCLKAMLNAQAMGYAVNQDRLFQHISAAQSHLEQWASGVGIPYLRPFMVALTANSVIRYHDTIAPLGIRERLQAVATKLKNEMWVESARAFKYTDRWTPEGGEEPAPDLNLLIAPMYAWLGDKEFAGKIFNSGVEQAWLGNLGAMKQFNQQVQFVEEFQQWMATPTPTPTASPSPTPTVANTPTASPSPTISPSPSPSPTVFPMPTVSPTPTPTTLPTVVPTPCQRPALMNSIKKLDTYTNCRISRIVSINNLEE